MKNALKSCVSPAVAVLLSAVAFAAEPGLFQTIRERTSIRRFDPSVEVPEAAVEQILRAGMCAPSAMNRQPWEFVVVRDPAQLAALAEALPFSRVGNGSKVAIVVCGKLDNGLPGRGKEYWIHDCSAATMNILLAVKALGFGAVWTGVYPGEDRVAAVRRILSIPATHMPLNVIPIGAPAENPPPKDKWDPAKIHTDRWNGGAPAELVLAARGKPAEYAIVVPEKPGETIVYAAEELRDWTEKLVGVRLPIETNTTPAKAVYLGDAAEAGLGLDGFRVKAEGGNVFVRAAGERGVLYGVYELLETYGGIGWFASWHAVVPRADRFAVPVGLNDRHVPAFPYREPFDYDINRHPEFAARLRRNCVTWGVPIPPRMGGLARQPAKVLKGHTANILCPVEKHFDAHPEWFSEISGQRIREKTQLCLTNPELIEFVKSNFVAQVKADPDASGYAFANNDWYNCCTCPNCKAVNDAEGSLAGTTIRMCNILAEELEKIAPGKTVKASAYQYTRRPPKLTKLRDNVLLDFAPIESDYSMPMNESPNADSRQICEDIRGWGRLASKAGLYVFDYVTNFESYYNPFPNVLSLQGNVRFFRDNKVKILYEEGAHTTPHAAFAELKTWLLAKLMWNPDLDVQAAIDRFIRGFYGPSAAPYVRRYFDALHALPRDPTKRKLGIFESFGSPVYPDAFLWGALDTWRAGERAAEADGPAYVRHVRWGMMSPVSMILQREGAAVCVKRTPYPDARLRDLAKWMIERMDEIGPAFLIGEGMVAHTKRLRARWTRLADPAQTVSPTDRAVAEADAVFNFWAGLGAKVADEPKASGGKAYRLPNNFAGNWILYMPMGTFGYDEGARYRLRLRVRVDHTAGAPVGPMFEAGVSGANVVARFATGADSDDYRWYDIGEWVPQKSQQIYVAPGAFDKSKSATNPAFDALWIDQVEFVRAGDPS